MDDSNNTNPPAGVLDDALYRRDVLLLASEDAELARAHRLADEAHQLGLKVPEIEVAASLTASLASGMVDLSSSSPVLSSGSSTCDGNTSTTPASGAIPPVPAGPAAPAPTVPTTPPNEGVPPLDPVTSSLSELTISSRPANSGSVRSIASLSTRPTSYCSSEGKWVYGFGFANDGSPAKQQQPHATNRNSMMSVVSGEKKAKRRASLMSAIGRIPFRRKRTPSSVMLPPEARITVSKGELGEDKVYVESKQADASAESPAEGLAVPAGPAPEGPAPENDGSGSGGASNEEGSVLRLEIPVFDQESLQRSLVNPELIKMRETHWLERNRHVAFQDALMSRVRFQQQAMVADRLADNKRIEDEMREQNAAHSTHMEERQLAVEMEQQREFERAKQNARTRIKHMEGYFNTRSPPSSPGSGHETLPQPRQYTEQQKAQLAQEYHDHESMDQLHEAKIKVLRERQERRLFEAVERMENELDDLIDKHAEAFAELQKQHQHEEASVLQALDAKKTRLRHRWNLEEAVQRRKLELQHEVPYGPLPPLTFNDSHYEIRDSAICVSDNAEEKQHQHQQKGDGTMI